MTDLRVGDVVRFHDGTEEWTVVNRIELPSGRLRLELDQDGRRLWTTPESVELADGSPGVLFDG